MGAVRLTPKMKLALETLYQTNGQEGYVAQSTANALGVRGLAAFVPASGPRTAGGRFPEYRMVLTSSGRSWCERHFAVIRRPSRAQ